ncbi:conserved Plasmodium protein, unknown function [Plasmodium gallinaceum]|uniref:Uncharacterized protein n=1 Tax=Plasmodium gallinaceum TaxID=5849 RepID=A0A1J1GWD7_PLAGA|nr:conserved Plasmodium protein, unknown function [Plasmodium gallinaceum]CRG96857.1 conserved Plasmodium protein, unknown function [Plasmodium gallinaceum]
MKSNQNNITDELLNEKKDVKLINESEENKYNLKSESHSSSEFEFNFKKNITDNFEVKNRGLFKLSLGNQTYLKSNPINENENEKKIYDPYKKKNLEYDNKNNGIIKPKFLEEDKTKNVDENKDKIISKLKKEIKLLTNKLKEKADKIENVQKDNFHLEQMYKNKYYIDIKKEKKKVIDIHSKNNELIRRLNYYSESFQQLKQKIRCLTRNVLSLIQCIDTTENLKFLCKNMNDISVILESTEYKSSEEDKYEPKENNEKLNIFNLKNVRNRNKKKENRDPTKKLYHSISSLHNNYKFTPNCKCTTKKKEKLGYILTNKKTDFLKSDSFLNCCKKINKQKKNLPNSPIKKKYSFEYYYNLKKPSNINSKKKNTLPNLSIHMKKISPETTENILNLFRKTRKINYLLRNSLNVENYKKDNSQKRNKSNGNYKKESVKRKASIEYTLKNNYYSIKRNSNLKKETLNNLLSKEIHNRSIIDKITKISKI